MPPVYKIFIALMMFLVSASVTPPQGSALPDNTITVTAYKLHGECHHLKLLPYVDRSGIYYSQDIVEMCHYVDSVKMVTAASQVYFTGVDGYVTSIEYWEVDVWGNQMPGTTKKRITGWWWTGDILPQGAYPPPSE